MGADLMTLQSCYHEETDNRVILHFAKTTLLQKTLLIRTMDTDVLMLSILPEVIYEVQEPSVALGCGSHFKLLPAHEIAASLGPSRARSLLVFHALTDYDTV